MTTTAMPVEDKEIDFFLLVGDFTYEEREGPEVGRLRVQRRVGSVGCRCHGFAVTRSPDGSFCSSELLMT
jgi:hypothetical protein